MRKFLSGSLLVGAAAAGAIALSASTASAAVTNWDVTNGNASGNFTVALASGAAVTFTDVNTTAVFSCTASIIHGNAPAGTGRTNPIATITDGSFTNCTGPVFSTGSATISAGALNGVNYDSPSDTAFGNITGISASLTINSAIGTCTGTVGGSIGTTNNQDTYANGTGTLTITADPAPQQLTIGSTAGNCAGLINPGDPVTFTATYVGTDPIPPITARPAA